MTSAVDLLRMKDTESCATNHTRTGPVRIRMTNITRCCGDTMKIDLLCRHYVPYRIECVAVRFTSSLNSCID